MTNLYMIFLLRLTPHIVFIYLLSTPLEIAIISQVITYKIPSFEVFCDSLIREKDKLLHLGVINIISTYNKALVAQKKSKVMHPKKKIPCNNKQNKVPKPSQPIHPPNNEK
jgi:hypothetical protein